MVIEETKVSCDRAKRISDRINLDGAIFANSIGLFRGLWVLWDSDQVEISEAASIEQEIHVIVMSTAKPPWLLSAIYASSRYAKRRMLWKNLESVASLHSMPWVITEDFNEVLMGEDKFGGSLVNINRALRFQDCLNNCRMIDIGFSGPRFTWKKVTRITVLLNCALRKLGEFNSSSLSGSNQCGFHTQPFKETWDNTSSLQQALSNFSSKVNSWNKNQFGNLFHMKRRILARLKGIQESISLRLNSILVDLESKLWLEYAKVAKLEEEFWAMKARILWLVEEDRNTSFYHTLAFVPQKQNCILCMKDSLGN
ncbi:uncharacterized protein LOC142632339 [Castanea sativa]|uniref:uncharacterized protein LOC142632339 n=1 Tax=Castanea sativa TaxID=21020 RepID=UPI003F64CFD6